MRGLRRLNCWEFKKCGQGHGGERSSPDKICPATTEIRLDGVHGGKNGGRSCWVIPGTLCDREAHGSFNEKSRKCSVCEFYDYVKSEEGEDYLMTINLLSKIQ